MRTAILTFLGLLSFTAASRAEDRLPSPLDRVDIEQRIGAILPRDLAFRDETGQSVRLGDYFSGRPVILVLAQYRCPMLCNEVLNGLTEGLRGVALDVGKDLDVVVVSFDTREEPALAAAKRRQYLERYGRAGAAGGWHFLTGGQLAIDHLAGAVGFKYLYDARTDRFAHAS